MLRLSIATFLGGCLLAVATRSTGRAQTIIAESANVLVVMKSRPGKPASEVEQTPAKARQRAVFDTDEATAVETRDKTAPSQEEMPGASPQEGGGKTRGDGATILLDIPLKFQAFYVGDVGVKIAKGGEISVRVQALADALRKIMKADAIEPIFGGERRSGKRNPAEAEKSTEKAGSEANLISYLFGPSTEGAGDKDAGIEGGEVKREESARSSANNFDYLPLSEIRRRGIDIEYNARASELTVAPTIEQKLDGNLSLGHPNEIAVSANSQKPAFVSAYLNTRMSLDYVSQSTSNATGLAAPNFDFEGAIRVGPLVIEHETALIARPSVPGGAPLGYDVARRNARAVYDDAENVIRLKAGDLTPGFVGFQSSPDLLGFSAERSYAELRPGQNIRPTGQRSFRIERPSNVDILVDGAIFRRVHLQPGNYNISDLPLKPGATKITLEIEEDTGARRTMEFTNFGGQDLLAPGLDEWQLAAGVQSIRAPARDPAGPKGRLAYIEPDYLWDEPIVTGFYRRGVSPFLTVAGNIQASSRVAMAGGSLSASSPYGYVSIDFAGSLTAEGSPGVAARSSYEVTALRDEAGGNRSFRLSAEFQSAAFATVGEYAAPLDYGAAFAALYSADLTEEMSASLGATLFLSRKQFSDISRWAAEFTVSRRFSERLSGAVSLGYGDDPRPGHASCACQDGSAYEGVKAFARISYRPDASSSLTVSDDERTRSLRAAYSQSSHSAGSDWNVSIDTDYDRATHAGDLAAGASYSGNRGEVFLTHASRIEGLDLGRARPQSTDERTSLRIETALAAADGAFSFGKPIQNSFAIVETHENLGGREVVLGPREKEIGHGDWFAPALVTNINPYAQRRVEYDVDDLPMGYDLGAGAFDFFGPYKAGYRVVAGSAYTVTATGTLLGDDGRPISLIGGAAREALKGNGRVVELFTNKAGRFGVQGLAPGDWILEMATEPEPTRFRLKIPAGTVGLYDSGALKPIHP